MPGHICILTSVHRAFDTRIFHKQAKTLSEAGYGVTLIAQHGKNECVDGINIIALPVPSTMLSRIMGNFRVFILALKQNAKVYHFHDLELVPVGILLKIFKGAKIIYDVHEDAPKDILAKEYIPVGLRGVASRTIAIVETACFPFLDAVIAASEDITWHLPKNRKVIIVGNFASLKMMSATPRNSIPVDENQAVTLIYVGGISEDRGIRQMVDALMLLKPRANLILVGSFENPGLEKEIRAIVGPEIDFVGQIDFSRVPDYLAKAQIGLVLFHPDPNSVTSAYRNNKIFEYMAAGIPVVASNFPIWKEIVEGNGCGLTVDPIDPAAIANAIQYISSHPAVAEKMRVNGTTLVREKYNWETESKKLLSLYEKLLPAAV